MRDNNERERERERERRRRIRIRNNKEEVRDFFIFLSSCYNNILLRANYNLSTYGLAKI